jgi:uncharacterized protein (DUF302 family)
MDTTRFTTDHVYLKTEKPFEEVTRKFENGVGRYEAEALKPLGAGKDLEGVRKKIEAMAGPSGFMLFHRFEHGALLQLAGQKRKANLYIVGNPLYAMQMTQHDIRTSLYAPLRVLIYEDAKGKTCLEYDQPSSLFGQFGNAKATEFATTLDRKLAALATASIE